MPDFIEAVTSGDRRKALTALRDLLTYRLAGCKSERDIASLSKQLMDVLKELDGVPNPQERSAVDEVAERRAARRGAGAAHPARAPRSS